MWLVVGLGNPGPTYRENRHNIGFATIDHLARERRARWRTAPDGLNSHLRVAGHPVRLLKPYTFMNRSGEVVALASRALDVPPERILVLHDDVDLPFGTLRLKGGGGHGGHNGLRSLIAALGDRSFLRVRLGVGRPPDGDVVAWVLGDFPAEDRAAVDQLVRRGSRAVRAVLADGLAKAASTFNARRRGPDRDDG